MAFRWRADDGPLLWYLDPLSPHQLKWHLIFFNIRFKAFCGSASAERERERERERDLEFSKIVCTLSREIHLWYIGTTNAQTSLHNTGLIGTFVSRKCNQKYRQSFKQCRSVVPDLGPHCLQTKMTETMPPPIP